MEGYGYDIKQTLITDIIPDSNVKKVRENLPDFFLVIQLLLLCSFFPLVVAIGFISLS